MKATSIMLYRFADIIENGAASHAAEVHLHTQRTKKGPTVQEPRSKSHASNDILMEARDT